MAHMHMGSPSEGFCSGPGYVMLNGFQYSKGNNCVLYLFQGAAVDTATKYGFALVGTLLLALVTEMLRVSRSFIAAGKVPGLARLPPLGVDATLALMFAVQMMAAYWLMLLVMLYEYVIFIFILLGLGVGHFIALQLQRKYLSSTGGVSSSALSSGSPCCGDSGAVPPKSYETA
jgi:hypothetical protein